MGGTLTIEGYMRLPDEDAFREALDLYRRLLRRLAYGDGEIERELGRLSWESLEEGGFGSSLPRRTLLASEEEIRVAPGLLGLSREESADDAHWLQCALYLDTERLTYGPFGAYRPYVGRGLWQLMRVWLGLFGQAGVYLTDAVGEGRSWEAITSSGSGSERDEQDALWSFDLALVPAQLAHRFSEVPPAYRKDVLEYGTGLARVDRWSALPWKHE